MYKLRNGEDKGRMEIFRGWEWTSDVGVMAKNSKLSAVNLNGYAR